MPRVLIYALLVLVPLSLVPLALVTESRTRPSSKPRVHLIQDMGAQPKLTAQAATDLFDDRRAMRLPVLGTVVRDDLEPARMKVSEALLGRGRQRFDIYCAPCHGLAGNGNGMVHVRALALKTPSWVQPANLHTDAVRSQPAGQLFDTISKGLRNMPAHAAQVPRADRWAIVAYVKALQLSQHAPLATVPQKEHRQP